MDKKYLEFPFKAPYLSIGSVNNTTQNIWIIFHGYGQLAEEFVNSFTQLYSEKNCVIFPQGLSKFYLKGVSQQTGANWMTSHDRKTDIKNYLNYLDHIFDLEIKPHLDSVKLNMLGFSQGGHTVSRWIQHSKIQYSKLVLWGSGLAHEIYKDMVLESFSNGENLIVIGDQDRFIDDEQLSRVKNRYAKIGFNYTLIEYDGGHEIKPDILSKIT